MVGPNVLGSSTLGFWNLDWYGDWGQVTIAVNFYEASKPVPVLQVQKEDAINNSNNMPLNINDQSKEMPPDREI